MRWRLMSKDLEDSQAKKLQELFEEVTENERKESKETLDKAEDLDKEMAETINQEHIVEEIEEAASLFNDGDEQESLPRRDELQEEVLEKEETSEESIDVTEIVALEEVEEEEPKTKNIEENTPSKREKEQTVELYEEMDVLNLPPRSEVHQSSKTRLSLSLKKPAVRFLFFLIFLALILVLIYFFYEEEVMNFINQFLS